MEIINSQHTIGNCLEEFILNIIISITERPTMLNNCYFFFFYQIFKLRIQCAGEYETIAEIINNNRYKIFVKINFQLD